jgi:hypothetical protein
LATAGFLIVGGPLILSGIHDTWRLIVFRGNFASIRAYLAESSTPWLFLWAGYFVLVVGGSAWLLWRRRNVSVVYNLDAATAHAVIADALDRLNLPWTRHDAVYFIGFGSLEPAKALGPSNLPDVTAARAVLEMMPAPALRHVTLAWSYSDGKLQQPFDTEFRRALEKVGSPENPAAGWFLGAATVLFVLLLILLALFIVFLWNLSR